MVPRTGRFQRTDRLLRPGDYRRLSREGKRASSGSFVLLLAERRPGERESPRLGITVSRKIGKAAVRNRLKRRIREWFRRFRGELPPDSDLVVIARSASAQLSGAEVSADLTQLAACVAGPRR